MSYYLYLLKFNFVLHLNIYTSADLKRHIHGKKNNSWGCSVTMDENQINGNVSYDDFN